MTNSTESASSVPKNETQVKNLVLKENIKFKMIELDLVAIEENVINESRSKLKDIRDKEKARLKRAAAINSLEAFLFELKDSLTQDEFVKCSTAEEREKISAKVEEVDNWLYETDNSVDTKVCSS